MAKINVIEWKPPKISPRLESSVEDIRRKYPRIPQNLVTGLVLYAKVHQRPGDFLCACLANDFTAACGRADPDSGWVLQEIAKMIWSEFPSRCHGSYVAIEDWVRSRREPFDMGEALAVLADADV